MNLIFEQQNATRYKGKNNENPYTNVALTQKLKLLYFIKELIFDK